jgi:MFS family permease
LTSVVLGLYLVGLGASPAEALLALGLSLAAGALLNVLVGRHGDRFGRRRALSLFGLLLAASGGVLALAPTLPVALAGLALGALSPSGSEVGPALALESSIIAEAAPVDRRARAFASYQLLGSVAAAFGALLSVAFTSGALGGGVSLGPLRFVFVGYAGIGLLTAALSRRLPDTVERPAPAGPTVLSAESRRRVARLSALFGVDSFAGGIAVQSFVALWFVTVYPASAPYVGSIFFAAGLLSALSFLVAARLAERFGLLETMVGTHLPSNVLLVLVPLAPTLGGALALYLARMSLSQMDVPTRQAYLAGIVDAPERTSANAWSAASRNVGQAGGPFAASWLVVLGGLSGPFFVGGALKIGYDLALLAGFRHVRPDAG